MSEAIYRQNAGQQDYTPGSAATAGQVVQLDDGRAGVVKTDLAASEKGAVYTTGIFDFVCGTSITFSAGVPIYWDVSADTAILETSAAEADFRIGTAVAAKTSGQLVARVDLNAGQGCVSNNFILSHVVEIAAFTDATVHTIIPAAWNKNGLLIMGAYGLVSEVYAGTEDQGITSIKDNEASPNTICTLTPSDAGADALKDIIVASGGVVWGASTGGLMATVAAGKSVTAACTQAVTGSGAGKMKVRVFAVPLFG